METVEKINYVIWKNGIITKNDDKSFFEQTKLLNTMEEIIKR